MLRHSFFMLVACIPCITCQLVVGVCPVMNRFVKDLDFERYSGKWYVVAQNKYHFMKAVDCQRVTYTPKGIGMTYSYNISKEDEADYPEMNGTIKTEGRNRGELMLRLKHLPWSRIHYRVMHTDYDKVAVEYTCIDGAISPLATISILLRHKIQWERLDYNIAPYNLTSLLTPKLRQFVKLIKHTECRNEEE